MRIAEAAVAADSPKEVEGLRAVERVRDLDPEGRWPVVDLYAAMIWQRLWLAAGTDAATADAASRARTNAERFLARTSGTPGQDANRARAKDLLDRLAKGR